MFLKDLQSQNSVHKSSSFLFWTINPVANCDGFSCISFRNARSQLLTMTEYWPSVSGLVICQFLPSSACHPEEDFCFHYHRSPVLLSQGTGWREFSRRQSSVLSQHLPGEVTAWVKVGLGGGAGSKLKRTWWSCRSFTVRLNWKTEGSKVSVIYHGSFLDISLLKTNNWKALSRAFYCNF